MIYRYFRNKKIIIGSTLVFFCIFFAFSPFSAKNAVAAPNRPVFVPVWDPGNFSVNAASAAGTKSLTIKEYILDVVLYKMINLVIQRISASTVNWINSGFRGSPAFVANPGAYFTSIANEVAGDFIYNNPNLNFLCGPIKARIRVTLAANYNRRTTPRSCTLDDVIGNMEDFINDFERGGWQKFFRLTQEQQNNPIGAYIQAEGDMARQIASRLDLKRKELDWGNGFLSFKTCDKLTPVSSSPTGPPVGIPIISPDGGEPTYSAPPTGEPAGPAVSGRSECIPGSEKISTPGSVLENQLNRVLGISGNRIAVANEINQIISALMNQLIGRVIGGIGMGLRSLSRPDPSNNNTIFTSQLHSTTTDKDINDYFKKEDDLLRQSIDKEINNGPYNPYLCRDNPNLPECLPPTDSTPTTSCDPATDPNCVTAPNVNPQVPSCPAGDFQCLFCRDNPTDPQCRQGINNNNNSSSI